MVIKYFKDYIDSINEGLIKTYPGEIASKSLSNLLIGLNINFNINFLENDNKIKLTFNFFNAIPASQLDNLFDVINSSIINKGGWFPSQMNITNIHGIKISLRYDLNNLYLNDEKSFNVYNKEKRKYHKNTYPVIYEIDNSDKFIKNLYKDPNYDNGFYTLDNISPNKIKIIK
jgi:hypothetical protein